MLNRVEYLGWFPSNTDLLFFRWSPPPMKQLRDVLIQGVDMMFKHLWDQTQRPTRFTSRPKPSVVGKKMYWTACRWYCLVLFTYGFEALLSVLIATASNLCNGLYGKWEAVISDVPCADTCTDPASSKLQSPWLYLTLWPSHRKMKYPLVN